VIRILLFIALMYFLYLVITKPFHELFGRPKQPKFGSSKTSSKKPKSKPMEGAEEMVACALCGTFISRREGEMRDGKFVCRPSCHHEV
jgi:formylmethanofuran dehydrogenase subunit E